MQTVTIVRRTPVNPQQAIGYKGIVDYTSGVVTSDVTLDCILTENCTPAAESTSVYEHAETSMILGEESYVLTSCNLTFQAGNPATVNYGYITAGLATHLLQVLVLTFCLLAKKHLLLSSWAKMAQVSH